MGAGVAFVQNITREGPGAIAEVLEERNIGYQVYNLGAGDVFPDPTKFGAIFVLGGPDSANDDNDKMRDEITGIQRTLRAGVPFLGICLGLQALVKAAGGLVVPGAEREIDFRDSNDERFSVRLTPNGRKARIFEGIEYEFPVFHLHGETVVLTPNMTLLGEGKGCKNQIVSVDRYRGKPIVAYGIQSHLELNEGMLRLWIKEDPWLQERDAQRIWDDWNATKAGYSNTGRLFINNFLKLAGF